MMEQIASDAGPGPNSSVPKTHTGISGLDEILGGGIPEGALTLLNGGPGAGKTIMGMEFLYRGALSGEPGIVLTFEERADSLRRNFHTLGWDIPALEEQGRFAIVEGRVDPGAVLSGEFDLRAMLAILERKADGMGARRVLFDGPDVFLRLLDNPVKERVEFYRINDWLRDRGITALMSVKRNSQTETRYDFLDYLADCVVELDQRVEQQVSTRRLRVVKYRGSDFGRNEYPFAIYRDGMHIIPVTGTSLRHRALGETVSTGMEKLDEILGGGLRRCSCNLVSGTSGTGKTTVACTFARSVCEEGENLLYIDFEESEDAVISGMLSPGIDLRPAVESGHLRFLTVMPESLGVEEHLVRAFQAIEEFHPAFVVVDAISACQRMGSPRAAFDYLLRLIDYCKQRGITTLLTNLASNQTEDREITGIDLSSVIDTVILMRNVEHRGQMRRVLLVLKSRGRAHSSRCHTFEITNNGIRIEGIYTGEEGVQ